MLLVAKRLYPVILILSVNNGFDKLEYAVASKVDISFRKLNLVIGDCITSNAPIMVSRGATLSQMASPVITSFHI